MQGQTVHDGRHAELTHAVVDVLPGYIIRGHTLGILEQGQVGTGQVSRTAEQLGQFGAKHVQGLQ